MITVPIILLETHEHAGRIYPPDTRLELKKSTADWLIALKKARLDPSIPVAPKPLDSKPGESKPV